jgi:hypothetical protein
MILQAGWWLEQWYIGGSVTALIIEMADTVLIYEVVTRLDGTKGIGNSLEVPVGEAISMIRAGLAKAEGQPIGVVPDGWLEIGGAKKSASRSRGGDAVTAEEKSDGGN